MVRKGKKVIPVFKKNELQIEEMLGEIESQLKNERRPGVTHGPARYLLGHVRYPLPALNMKPLLVAPGEKGKCNGILSPWARLDLGYVVQ